LSTDKKTFVSLDCYECLAQLLIVCVRVKVMTARPLDRERTALYSLMVRCQDAGDEPRVTQTSIQVTVVDVNDNSPVFTAQTYRGTLVENNYIGASVLQA